MLFPTPRPDSNAGQACAIRHCGEAGQDVGASAIPPKAPGSGLESCAPSARRQQANSTFVAAYGCNQFSMRTPSLDGPTLPSARPIGILSQSSVASKKLAKHGGRIVAFRVGMCT